MRRLLITTVALLSGAHVCLAQVSTMGTTAMGLSSMPGAIVTSPLNGPSPFSAMTQPGTPDTTLAPVPLASDPTMPGTVVTCAAPAGQITPGTPIVQVTPVSPMVGTTTGATPSISAPTTASAVPANASTLAAETTTAPAVPLSSLPATSFMSDLPGSTVSAPPPPEVPPLPAPSIAPVVPASAPVTITSTLSTSVVGTTTTAPTLPPAGVLGTIATPIAVSTIGNI